MEAEHLARTRLGITAIGEAGDDAGGFVKEVQRLLVVDPLQLGLGVAFGLRFNLGDFVTQLFLLCLNDTERLFIYDKA